MTRELGIPIILATLLFEAALVFGASEIPGRIAEGYATTFRERAGDIEETDPRVESIVGLNLRWMIDHESLFRIRCEREVFDEFVRRHGMGEADDDHANEIARVAGELAPSWREPLPRPRTAGTRRRSSTPSPGRCSSG